MFEELATQSWSSSSLIFPKAFCEALALECQNLASQGLLTLAAVGHGSTKTNRTDIRGDFTRWLTEDDVSPLSQQTQRALSQILNALNQAFYLGLQRHEAHFAYYPPGAGYEKHIDNHRGSGARKITFILYLNENWQKDHGGELSIFDPQNPDCRIAQVEPRLGTFVLFRSELFPHQVEKSFQPRRSLTGWFRNDAL